MFTAIYLGLVKIHKLTSNIETNVETLKKMTLTFGSKFSERDRVILMSNNLMKHFQ